MNYSLSEALIKQAAQGRKQFSRLAKTPDIDYTKEDDFSLMAGTDPVGYTRAAEEKPYTSKDYYRRKFSDGKTKREYDKILENYSENPWMGPAFYGTLGTGLGGAVAHLAGASPMDTLATSLITGGLGTLWGINK